MILWPSQEVLKQDIYRAWDSGHRNVCAVLPTGGGKTVIFSSILNEHDGVSIAIAHRQELVSQISLALAKFGVRHDIIASKNVIKWITALHVRHHGTPFYYPGARCTVAGVDTLIRRPDNFKNVSLWVIDECHHVLQANKWGAAARMFPNARGLGVTATPIRADGKGLSRESHGVFDALVKGPTMRELINRGRLTDYRIVAPPNDLDLSHVDISARTGDYNRNQLVTTVRKSKVVGDIVSHYGKYANGRLGVTFATDVETAGNISAQFNAAGIPSEALSAKTPDRIRHTVIERFARRELLQLVNVDLFGEGFDLPAIEVVQMGRPTQSYSLYCQQFGRALRTMEGKEKALIIDHVGNVMRHGLPDKRRFWSLEPRDSRSTKASDTEPVKVCPKCTGVYEAFLLQCPYCGYKVVPTDRSKIEFVEGDLIELDEATLMLMRGEVTRIDSPSEGVRSRMLHAGAPLMVAAGAAKQHTERQRAQAGLRYSMGYWAAKVNRPMQEMYRMFYHRFGIDVLSAQALGRPQAHELMVSIFESLREE